MLRGTLEWARVGIVFAVVAAGVALAGPSSSPEQNAAHADGPSTQKNPGYVRPRVNVPGMPGNGGSSTAGSGNTSYVTTGEYVPADDLVKQLEEELKRVYGDEIKTGEKKPSEQSTMVKNQKRPGLPEPKPEPF